MAVEKEKRKASTRGFEPPPFLPPKPKRYLSNSTFRSCVLRVMSPARFHCAMLLVGELFWFFVLERGLGISIGLARTSLFFSFFHFFIF